MQTTPTTLHQPIDAARTDVMESKRRTTARRASPTSARTATTATVVAATPRTNLSRGRTATATSSRVAPAHVASSARMSTAERRAATVAAIQAKSASAPSSPSAQATTTRSVTSAPSFPTNPTPRSSAARSVARSPSSASRRSSTSRPAQAQVPVADPVDTTKSQVSMSDVHALMAQFVQAQDAKIELLKRAYDDKIAQLERQGSKCDCKHQVAVVATLETTVSGLEAKLNGMTEDFSARVARVEAQANATEARAQALLDGLKVKVTPIVSKTECAPIRPPSPPSLPKPVQSTPNAGRLRAPVFTAQRSKFVFGRQVEDTTPTTFCSSKNEASDVCQRSTAENLALLASFKPYTMPKRPVIAFV